MATLANFPNLRPSLYMDFANSRRVDPRITCVRNTTASRYNAIGGLETVPANVPRIDFDPGTGECKGLLIEEQRTNLLRYSQNIGDATWQKGTAVTVADDNARAPDGSMTAATLTLTGSAVATNRVQQFTTYSVSAGVVAAFSIWLRADVPFTTAIRIANLADSDGANFNITLTTVWQRFVILNTFTSASNSIRCCIANSSNSGVFQAWGGQLEIGAFPTSYIPTATAQVTRAADDIRIPSSVAAQVISANFTVVQQTTSFADVPAAGVTRTLGPSIFSGGNNRVRIAAQSTLGGNILVQGRLDNSSTSREVILLQNIGNKIPPSTVAYTVSPGAAVRASINGSVANSSLLVGGLSNIVPTIYFGTRDGVISSTEVAQNGHIQRLMIYPVTLTDSQLQRLTTP